MRRPKPGLIVAVATVLMMVCLSAGCTSNRLVPVSLTTVPYPFTGRVYIGEGVNNPGIYPVRAEDTLAELVLAAGGLKPGADFGQVQLLFVSSNPASAAQKIDINLAPKWLLEALPGIGPSLADAIIEYRNLSGPFRSVEELTRVSGIGPATLEKLRDFITVSTAGQAFWP